MSTNSVCNHTSDNKIGRPQRKSDLFITSMITDRIGLHSVLLPLLIIVIIDIIIIVTVIVIISRFESLPEVLKIHSSLKPVLPAFNTSCILFIELFGVITFPSDRHASEGNVLSRDNSICLQKLHEPRPARVVCPVSHFISPFFHLLIFTWRECSFARHIYHVATLQTNPACP